jgi:hypothetical protein
MNTSDRREPVTNDDRLTRMARELPRDLSPGKDLWPGIAAQISTPAERRFGSLPGDVAVPRDLWPSIRARIAAERPDERRGSGAVAGPGFRLARTAHGAGILAVAAILLAIAIRFDDLSDAQSITGSTAGLPVWMADMLDPFDRAAPGTPQAELGETARSIRRDFLMVQAERAQIERALAVSVADTNLRTQWRRVYMAELRLIDEAQKLGITYETRIES